MHSEFGQTQRPAPFIFIRTTDETENATPTKPEQNGCRQRLEWHLSCHRRLPLAVA